MQTHAKVREKGLVNNHASPRGKAGMREKGYAIADRYAVGVPNICHGAGASTAQYKRLVFQSLNFYTAPRYKEVTYLSAHHLPPPPTGVSKSLLLCFAPRRVRLLPLS